MNKNFKSFLEQLLPTNVCLNQIVDFEKVFSHVDAIAMRLHQLNFLLGKSNLEEAVSLLWNENPKVFEVLDILIAVRAKEKKQVISSVGEVLRISRYFETPQGVTAFIQETGLKELFQSGRITNLVDYVLGVEVGLDTNARKNRGGKIMEETIRKALLQTRISFKEQVSSSFYKELSCLGKDKKIFDFVIETRHKTYLIEVNFYSSGGSKLNEVARAYTKIQQKIQHLAGFEFVWITDGTGWLTAKNKLEEAFCLIPRVYNLSTFSLFLQELSKQKQ